MARVSSLNLPMCLGGIVRVLWAKSSGEDVHSYSVDGQSLVNLVVFVQSDSGLR